MTHGNAPAPMPTTTHPRRGDPSFQTRARARAATIAAAGAEGYSVTVAHPAARPRTSPQNKSSVEVTLPRNFRAQANANTRHAPASACPQNKLEYAHMGVARPNASAVNADAPTLLPSCREIQNRQAHAAAMGRATANTVTS